MKITWTADYAFDAADAVTGDPHALYRCNECMALVESFHVRDHLNWHSQIIYTADSTVGEKGTT